MGRDLRVVFIGDSFIQGTSCDETLGWTGQVGASARKSGVDLTFFNLGIRGETGPEIARRAAAEISPRLIGKGEGRAVVLAFAANDVVRGTPREESLAAAREILTWAQDQGFTAFFVGPPPSADPERHARRKALAEALYGVAAELGVPTLDLYAAIDDWSLWFEELSNGDGAHPNTGGYALISRVFDDWAPWQAWSRG